MVKKRVVGAAVTIMLLLSLLLSAYAESAVASTLRLEKTVGDVSLCNKNGKSLTINESMKLFSGYVTETAAESYAYISLDATKAVKMDALSKTEVRQSGKKLEAALVKGQLFFDVSGSEAGSELTIRTSNTVTGIRGTSGVVSYACGVTVIIILDGEVDLSVVNPFTGESWTFTVAAGEMVAAGPGSEITRRGQWSRTLAEGGGDYAVKTRAVSEGDVPGFAAVEIARDAGLAARVDEQSGLSAQAIAQGAEARLAADEAQAAAAYAVAEKDAAEQGADDKVVMYFTGQQVVADTGAQVTPPAPPPPPPGSILVIESDFGAALAPGVYADGGGVIAAALAQHAQVTVISNNGSSLNMPAALEIPGVAGGAATNRELVLDASAAAVLTAGTQLTVNGTLTVNGALDTQGALVNNSAHTITVAGTLTVSGGSLTNNATGRIAVAAGGLLDVQAGVPENTGLIELYGRMAVDGVSFDAAKGATGELHAAAGSQVDISGAGVLYITGGAVMNLDSGATVTGAGMGVLSVDEAFVNINGQVSLGDDSQIYSDGEVTVGATGVISTADDAFIVISSAGAFGGVPRLQNNGAITLASSIINAPSQIMGDSRLVNAGVLSITGGHRLENLSSLGISNTGAINIGVSGGEGSLATPLPITGNGTVNFNAGVIEYSGAGTFISGGSISLGDDAILMLPESASIAGTVDGAYCDFTVSYLQSGHGTSERRIAKSLHNLLALYDTMSTPVTVRQNSNTMSFGASLGDITVKSGFALTYDLNGKTLSLDGVSIINSGSLTLTNGVAGEGGTVNLGSGGGIISDGAGAVFTLGEKVSIKSASASGAAVAARGGAAINITGGTVRAAGVAIKMESDALTLSITGGTVVSTGDGAYTIADERPDRTETTIAAGAAVILNKAGDKLLEGIDANKWEASGSADYSYDGGNYYRLQNK